MKNADEIKKALENEIHLAEYVDSNYCDNTEVSLLKSVLDLINQYETEIDRLKTNREHSKLIVQRLKEKILSAKTETIKEFEERFKSIAGIYQKDTYVIGVDEFDNLLKEMGVE